MNVIKAIKQGIEALEEACGDRCNAEYNPCYAKTAITDLHQALSELEQRSIADLEKQEPVGHADLEINNIYLFNDQEQRVVPKGRQPLYTHPQPQRTWVGLTEREIDEAYLKETDMSLDIPWIFQFGRSLEAKLKEKNT